MGPRHRVTWLRAGIRPRAGHALPDRRSRRRPRPGRIRRLGVQDRAGLVPACAVPARVPRDHPGPRSELRPRPGPAGGGRLRREPLQPGRPLGRRRDRTHAASSRDRRGNRSPHRRLEVRRRRSPRPGETSATAPGISTTCDSATATSGPRSPRTTLARATSTAGGARASASSSPRRARTWPRSNASGASTRRPTGRI